MDKIIYLDNASTTKPSAEAIEAVTNALECYGNPSSLHSLGLESEKLIEKSRNAIASKLGADRKKVYFTSGGTEANNTAIFGAARSLKKRGNKIITSKIEHPSVLESFRALEKEGFTVVYLDVTPDGIVDIEQAKNEIDENTSLVSVMTVNNETGIIQPVREIGKILHEKSEFGVFHTDAVQAFGKVPCGVRDTGADLISVSSHKIHGPKGVGALYVGKGRLSPIIFGGSQQGAVRPGTENVPGIAGFGAAACKDLENCDILYDTLKKGILDEIPDVKINGCEEFASKFVLNVSFIGVKAEVLLHTLENYNVFVSTGSACSSHKPDPSHVLTAMGLSREELGGAVRFSFSSDNTLEDIEKTIQILIKEVAVLRRYTRNR